MNLPTRALALVCEYSKPVTRPDWRKLNRLPLYKLYGEIMKKKQNNTWIYSSVFQKFVYDIQRGNTWSDLYGYSELYGIESCSEHFGIQYNELLHLMNRSF
jgi:hypothetical protein